MTLCNLSAQRANAPLRTAAAALLLSGLVSIVPLAAQAGPAEKPAAAKSMQQHGKINVNTASVDMLAQLNGIGAAKAQAIIEYRDKFGRFQTLEDLLAVEGVGQATLAKNRSLIEL